jgi:hypothetical protein
MIETYIVEQKEILTCYSNPVNMNEDKKDVTIINKEELRENLKVKFDEFILVFNDIESMIRSSCIPERMDVLKDKEVWDLFNKVFAWFFAISVGTLLWVLSNFDKFIISDKSMPNKNLYISAIILLGFSSLILAGIQGISYWYQHKNTKYAHKYIMNFSSLLRDLCNHRNELNNALEELDSRSIEELQRILSESRDYSKSLILAIDNLNKLFDPFEKSYSESSQIGYSEHIIILPVIIYIFGIIAFSIYIILYLINYI